MQDVTTEKKEYTPNIVAFCCNWCSYAGGGSRGFQPSELSCQRQNYPRSLLLPRQSHVCPESVSAGRRRRNSLRLSSRRLPLCDGQLLYEEKNGAVVQLFELSRNRKGAHARGMGFRRGRRKIFRCHERFRKDGGGARRKQAPDRFEVQGGQERCVTSN